MFVLRRVFPLSIPLLAYCVLFVVAFFAYLLVSEREYVTAMLDERVKLVAKFLSGLYIVWVLRGIL